MNILVILRAVQDPAGITVNRKAQKVFVNRAQHVFNPSDRNALEAALRLGGEVTAVAFGAGPAEQVLRDARAMGARRALLVNDSALGGADAFVLANVLGHVLDHLGGADLVLCGAECLDADLAQVGPRLAQCLERPFIAGAHQIEVRAGAVRAVAARGGRFVQVEADLPAVISVTRDSNKPRYAPGKNLINVYSDAGAVETVTTAALGMDPAELTPLTEARGEAFPPEREPGKRLEGDIAGQLADILRQVI